MNEACARRPGAAASVSDRRREHHTLLAGGGRRASRSHTLAASQAFERVHTLACHWVKHLCTRQDGSILYAFVRLHLGIAVVVFLTGGLA